MLETQEPKYDVILSEIPGKPLQGRIVNRATGVPIPDDEPVFILRAKDRAALGTLYNYLENSRITGSGQEQQKVVLKRIADFATFRSDHQDRVKVPD